jgi:hypothetical protein
MDVAADDLERPHRGRPLDRRSVARAMSTARVSFGDDATTILLDDAAVYSMPRTRPQQFNGRPPGHVAVERVSSS